jgi:hypothetical protein
VLVVVLALVVAPRPVLAIVPWLVLVAVLVLDLLKAVGDEVSRLAALEACPRVPPHVHSVLVKPLEPSLQECQLILSKHIELLIWQFLPSKCGGLEPRSWYGILGS